MATAPRSQIVQRRNNMPAHSSLQIDDAHRLLVEHGRWFSRAAFERYHAALFHGISFRGRRVLDVGGGIGTCSFLAALSGASSVLCLDPEGDGASSGSTSKFQELATLLGLGNTTLEVTTLQRLQVPPRSFDVIIVHNSINHIDEQACVDLRRSEAARKTYRETIFPTPFLRPSPVVFP